MKLIFWYFGTVRRLREMKSCKRLKDMKLFNKCDFNVLSNLSRKINILIEHYRLTLIAQFTQPPQFQDLASSVISINSC